MSFVWDDVLRYVMLTCCCVLQTRSARRWSRWWRRSSRTCRAAPRSSSTESSASSTTSPTSRASSSPSPKVVNLLLLSSTKKCPVFIRIVCWLSDYDKLHTIFLIKETNIFSRLSVYQLVSWLIENFTYINIRLLKPFKDTLWGNAFILFQFNHCNISKAIIIFIIFLS